MVQAEMADAEGGTRVLSDDEAANFALLLIAAGTETVARLLGWSAILLDQHPDQRAALVADPSRMPAAFEEILRLNVPLQFGTRTLVRDAVVAGEPMRAGQRVIVLYISANRDAREFVDPDRFDIRRRPERQLGFGTGIHFCIGAHAARLEGIVVLQELLARVPHWEVDVSGVERLPSEFQIGDTAVPIEFAPRR